LSAGHGEMEPSRRLSVLFGLAKPATLSDLSRRRHQCTNAVNEKIAPVAGMMPAGGVPRAEKFLVSSRQKGIKRILAALAGLLALTAGVASANAKPVHNTPTYQYYDYAPARNNGTICTA